MIEVLIAIAPTWTHKRINDAKQAERCLYQKLIPHPGRDTPIVVDHDPDERIGVVRSFLTLEVMGEPWIVAKGELDREHGWLRKGTGASFEFIPLEQSPTWPNYFPAVLVSEVTVVRRATPADPQARVLRLERKQASEANPPAVTQAVGGMPGQILRRPGSGYVIAVR